MGPRPRLKPDFRPLRRGQGAVQLGSSAAGGGIIVTGLGPGEIALLDQLDGSHPEEDLYAAAARAGVERDRTTQLLDLLRTHRVLLAEGAGRAEGVAGRAPDPGERARGDPAAQSARRPAPVAPAWVVVDGTAAFVAAVASVLRAGNLGRVDAGPWAADVADAEMRDGERWAGTARPGLLVLVDHGGLDPRAGEPWRRRGIPVLPVVIDGERVVVGPVVGADPALPCLRCLGLRRLDGAVERAHPIDLRPDVASVAAGVVGMVVGMVTRAALGDDPVPPGVSVEVAAPWPRLDHRRWTRHPACPAHGPAHGPNRLG